ncbi:MAG: Fic family protein [Phycisphaerales bacterium]|nr:Fic family protein [Phycisphaerales bacterium]
MVDRVTGIYKTTRWHGEEVRSFVPHPLPPAEPPIQLDSHAQEMLARAMAALGQLSIAGDMVPSTDWFLYGFARKEALASSQIEGTQATLQDVLTLEAGAEAQRPRDVREVCNYIKAVEYARAEMARAAGLPISVRLLCEAHRLLMEGCSDKLPGEIRRSQNWIGGSRPGNAHFVPPPADCLADALSSLEKWIHAASDLPTLVRVALAHAQFETIHPFLDGNGRVGRMLIALLIEHWLQVAGSLLYISVAFKQRQGEYYARLDAVRLRGDWEGWIIFFLSCVVAAVSDAVAAIQRLFALTTADVVRVTTAKKTTVAAIRLVQLLPRHPVMTIKLAENLLNVSKPTAGKAVEVLCRCGVLKQTNQDRRNRVYAYSDYLAVLSADTSP